MTVQAVEPAVPPEEALALAHAEQQALMRLVALQQVIEAWQAAPLDITALLDWWFSRTRDDVYTLTAIGQELMASEATSYVRDSLALQGYRAEVPTINAINFAGVASDGTDLYGLLDTVPLAAWRHEVMEDNTHAEAMAKAEYLLRRIVHQQTTDAGREADQAAIVGADVVGLLTPTERRNYVPLTAMPPLDTRVLAPPPAPNRQVRDERLAERKRLNRAPVGWIRLLTPPSCGRCALLAGKWYGWNDGFARHDNCDCRHVPALEADSGDLTTDPRRYFDSLDEREQEALFGKANAEAIREGADIGQVINAGTFGVYTVDGRQFTNLGRTSRGHYGRETPAGRAKIVRLTPLQIYREAKGDRIEARRLLRRFGYFVE